MPTALNERPAPYETTPNRLRWTRQQCDALREAGFLTGRYELIDGEIISKMGQNSPHAFVVRALLAWLTRLFGPDTPQIQGPIDLSEISPEYDEPEPDAAVTARPYTDFAGRLPGPADLLLLVEVSDTTLRFDLNVKAALYARASIPDYWVVDIPGRRVVVHRHPAAAGYAEVTAYGPDEFVATLARPDAPVRVADLLPPA